MKKNGEHFVTCGQMKILERRADESGLSYYRMMENAGTGAADMITESVAKGRKLAEKSAVYEGVRTASNVMEPMCVYVFCGKGNNGGDGFVAARILHDRGHEVTVILVDGEPKSRDAVTNLGLLKVRDLRILDMSESSRALIELKKTPDAIIDAIYGTGFRGQLDGNALKAVSYINRYSRIGKHNGEWSYVKIVALDIPSGLRGDMLDLSEADEKSVIADLTITFHAKKPVHLQSFSESLCGEILVVDIGIDEEKLWNV